MVYDTEVALLVTHDCHFPVYIHVYNIAYTGFGASSKIRNSELEY